MKLGFVGCGAVRGDGEGLERGRREVAAEIAGGAVGYAVPEGVYWDGRFTREC
jgi:hypothetical protein